MAQQTEPILRAFAGRLDLRTGYQFSQHHINTFLATVQANPQALGASQADMLDVQALCGAIAQLRAPDGHQYLDASLRPRQHVQRLLHPNWPRPYISKFKLRKSAFQGVEFWALADMLGMLLGLLGPAPAAATKRNFFLPLTAMYGKWCHQLCSESPPRVIQCTWSARDGSYFLGASMSGHNAEKRTNGLMASGPKQSKILSYSD